MAPFQKPKPVNISGPQQNILEIDEKSVFPIDSNPFGFSYGEWSAKWWQWLLSIPSSSNPTRDPTGQNASINQPQKNVFFLCQTYEGVKTIPYRTIEIPKDNAIFIPVINWISLHHLDGETDKELLNCARERMDVVANLEITVNGTTTRNGLENYRCRSPFFDVNLPEDNIVDLKSGKRRAISDGFWLFFKPRKTGITLDSFGSCSSGVTKIGVGYRIAVH